MMKKFTQITEKKKEKFTYEYGCVMMKFDIPEWKDILKLIDKDDIYDVEGFGLEKESHITILFGLLKDVPEDDIKERLASIPKPLIELKNISIFSGNEYDVVKFDIECQLLNNLHDSLSELPKKEDDHPVYHPHMTISYVKPGRGVKYIQQLEKTIISKPSKMIYSKPDEKGNKIKVDLNIW